jgi:hypothetical protein
MTYTVNESNLLNAWKEKASGWRWIHYHSMNHYKRINTRFVYTSIILSTIAGAGGFTTAGQKEDSTIMGDVQFYMGYLIGVINVIIGLVNSFQRFGKPAEKTELHGSAAMQYAMLHRLIETELSLSQEHRKSDLIPHVRQEMDRLLTLSPSVPGCVVDRFMKTFPDATHIPDVCNQIKTPIESNSPLHSRFANVFRQMKEEKRSTDSDVILTTL